MTWTIFAPGELRQIVFPEPPFLVSPLLPRSGLAMIHGAKTAGKTQLALTLGVAVARGETFLHEYPCNQGSVVFLEADMPKQMLQYRIADAPETDVIQFVHTEPFDIVKLAQSTNLPDGVKRVQDSAPALLIVDTLRKIHFLDESDSRTPLFVYSAWKRLFPDTALLFIHHDRKRPRDPEMSMISDEAARGTEAWTSDIDVSMYLHKHRSNKNGEHSATLGFSKVRYSEDIAPFVIQMRPDSLLVEPNKPTARQALFAWLKENPVATMLEAANWLQNQEYCGKTRAYKLLAEIGTGWKWASSRPVDQSTHARTGMSSNDNDLQAVHPT